MVILKLVDLGGTQPLTGLRGVSTFPLWIGRPKLVLALPQLAEWLRPAGHPCIDDCTSRDKLGACAAGLQPSPLSQHFFMRLIRPFQMQSSMHTGYASDSVRIWSG